MSAAPTPESERDRMNGSGDIRRAALTPEQADARRRVENRTELISRDVPKPASGTFGRASKERG